MGQLQNLSADLCAELNLTWDEAVAHFNRRGSEPNRSGETSRSEKKDGMPSHTQFSWEGMLSHTPFSWAVVKAKSIEVTGCDPDQGNFATVHLRCGRCNHCSREQQVTSELWGPADVSYKQHLLEWYEHLSNQAWCPHCGVLNSREDPASFLLRHPEYEGMEVLPPEYYHSPLAIVQAGQRLEHAGLLGRAEGMYRYVIDRNADVAAAHLRLANLLRYRGCPAFALPEYEEAIRLKPDYAEAYCELGDALEKAGRFAEAAAARRRGHELGSQQAGWQWPSADWLRRSERLLELEAKLPSVLAGDYEPSDNAERLGLAFVCQAKEFYAAAARLYGEALDDDSRLGNDDHRENLYDAACAALRAGRGKGLGPSDDALARRHWCERALEWLRAYLASARRYMADGKPSSAQDVRRWLCRWWSNSALTGVTLPPEPPEDSPAAECDVWLRIRDDFNTVLGDAFRALENHDPHEEPVHDPDTCYDCLLKEEVTCTCRCGVCCRRLLIEASVEDAAREPRIKEKGRPFYDINESGEDELEGYSLNGKDHACVFLDQATNLCTIYETRPLGCRLFDCEGEGKEKLIELGILQRERPETQAQ